MTSDNYAKLFGKEETLRIANECNNNKRWKGPVEVDDFYQCYTEEDSRGELNRAIWNGNLPAEHPTKDRQYLTVRGAYRKLVRDADFYVATDQEVLEIARRSYYPTTF
jgi:hypothetical protein